MRKFLWAILAILVLALSAPYASADTTESFNFSGTFIDSFNGSNSVTGTFTLDLTNGTITAFDFTTPLTTVDASNGFSASLFTFNGFDPNTPFVLLKFDCCGDEGDSLFLYFQTDLASFSGSTFFPGTFQVAMGEFTESILICGIVHETTCSGPEGATGFFESGSATPITTAPEPASLLLLGSGLLGLAGIKRRRSAC